MAIKYVFNPFSGTFDAIEPATAGVLLQLPIVNGVVVTAGDCLAASTVSSRVDLANANNNTNGRFIGVATVGGTGDVGGTVLATIAVPGDKLTDAGASFTPGAALYLPDGTGRPSETPPANVGDLVQRVGWALSATEYIIDPGPAVIL